MGVSWCLSLHGVSELIQGKETKTMAMTLIKMQTLNNSNSEFETTGAFLLFWGLKWKKFPDIYL